MKINKVIGLLGLDMRALAKKEKLNKMMSFIETEQLKLNNFINSIKSRI